MQRSGVSLRTLSCPLAWWRGWPGQAGPYVWPLILAATFPALFWADALVRNRLQQHLLGLAMFGLLFAATRPLPARERRVVWLAVGVWSVVEVFASVVWGLYHYRLSGVPLFVPPGHGAVYVFGLRASQTPLMRRHARKAGRAALACAGIWAICGLVVFPHWMGRIDLAGALLWPILALAVRWSRAGAFYTGIFLVTSLLEIAGTALGTWAWAPAQPLTALPSGNPPSVIAGAYCLVDLLLLRLARGLGFAGAQPPAAAAPGSADGASTALLSASKEPLAAD